MNYINPTSLTIITTYTCTSACRNCCFSCSPKRTERLTLDEIKNTIDKCLKAFPSIKIVIFTGGEPFLLQEELVSAISYVNNKQKLSRIVSNAFWARSYKQAYHTLRALKEAGLTEINYSTGDEHQEFVPYDNIVYACRAALDLALPVAVNIETNEYKKFNRSVLDKDIRLHKYRNEPSFIITNGQWVTYKKESDYEKKTLPQSKEFISQSEDGCDTLFNNITISPDGKLLSCCGFFAPKSQFLQFGKLEGNNISELYTNQFDDFLKIWLYTSGPHRVAQFINRYKKGSIECSNKHACAICEQIYSNPENISIIKKHCHDIIPQIIFDYECDRNIIKRKQKI